MTDTGQRQEEAARKRLEHLVREVVERIRDAALTIEREASRNLASAAEEYRELEFQNYPRVAGRVLHELQTLAFNIPAENLISAATDAELARTQREEEDS